MKRFGTQERVAWLYLDMNSYFASVEQQIQPQLRGKPVAVVPVESDATCAIAASYEAKAYGVKTGTKIYEAKKMCPGLICVPARHDAYVEYHDRFLKSIDRLIPVHTVYSIDEVACELQGVQCTPEGGVALARAIKTQLQQDIGAYIRCSIGLSSNRLLAKIAAETEKPDGLVIMAPDGLCDALEDKPLTTLPGIGAGMEARLSKAGIWSIDQLIALSPKHMRTLWGGVGGERYYYSLRGVQLPEQETQKRTVGHSHVLDPNWRPREMACYVARRLTLKAASRLRRFELEASKLTLSLRIEHGPRVAAEARFDPAYDTITLMRRLMALWHGLIEAYRPERIKKIAVTLHGLCEPDTCQDDLFASETVTEIQRKKRHEQLSRAMDTLNSRYGRDTITMGGAPKEFLRFSGTKIAFARIPDKEEFYE